MSKMDGLRAMREARYAQAMERAKKAAAAPKPTARPAAAAPAPTGAPATERVAARVETPAPAEAGAAEQLCGHRSMNGRTCTREHGHAAKSHRYS